MMSYLSLARYALYPAKRGMVQGYARAHRGLRGVEYLLFRKAMSFFSGEISLAREKEYSLCELCELCER